MNQIPHSHPLDKLISDDRLFLLEAILPFVEGPMRMPLVIYLKMMELQQIMRVINNHSLPFQILSGELYNLHSSQKACPEDRLRSSHIPGQCHPC